MLFCAAIGGYCFYLAHRSEVTGTSDRMMRSFLQGTAIVCYVATALLFLGLILDVSAC